MSNFKLLAIRPLDQCSEQYRKVLQPGEIYPFYYEYVYHLDANKNVHSIEFTPKVPANLSQVKTASGKALSVNVSAIVGKNGVGKSTLFEMLFLVTYALASKKEILQENSTLLKKDLEEMERSAEDHAKDIIECRGQIKDQEYLIQNVAAELFYLKDDQIHCLRLENSILTRTIYLSSDDEKNTFVVSRVDQEVDFQVEDTFYTIAVNYSLYGLNSKYSGRWLKSLFHKNDGYQTPIVINPMRTEGIIDVNSELHLAQSRLLANLMDGSMEIKEVLSDKKVTAVDFNLDPKKLESFYVVNLDNVINRLIKDRKVKSSLDIFKSVYEVITKEKFDTNKTVKKVLHFADIVKYVIKKLVKIASKYTEYSEFYSLPKNPPIPVLLKFDDYLVKLEKDHTHITLKLRQILNCVRFDLLKEDQKKGIMWKDGRIRVELHELIRRIRAAKKKAAVAELVELMPVAFFTPEFEVSFKSKFFTLSSGEQQLVHTTQSILYHLINLNTVFKTNGDKIAYHHVNLMLDEIELYFHPEFQKQLVSELIGGITKLKIDHIKSLNILFSTHSPFILSDIPGFNILRLAKGRPYPSAIPTLGANIHDMLADSFFLKQGYMGDYAKHQINSVIDFLEKPISIVDANTTVNNPSEKVIGWDKESARAFINLIGEPLLRNSLEDLYYSVYRGDLQIEIDKLLDIQKRYIKS